MTYKRCSKCREHKPFSEFYRRLSPPGWYSWCRKCNQAHQRDKRAEENAALAIVRKRNRNLPAISTTKVLPPAFARRYDGLVPSLLSVFCQIDQMRR